MEKFRKYNIIKFDFGKFLRTAQFLEKPEGLCSLIRKILESNSILEKFRESIRAFHQVGSQIQCSWTIAEKYAMGELEGLECPER